MGIENYKLKADMLIQYLETAKGMNFVIDFTALLRLKAEAVLGQLATIPRSKCCWYVIPKFEKQIEALLENGNDSSEIFFYTDRMMDSLEACWDSYSNLPIHLSDDVSTSYEFFQKLSGYGSENCLITGNETEAWRHILNKKRGHIILVTDDEAYFFLEPSFRYLIDEYGSMLSANTIAITNDSLNECKTLDGRVIKFEEILSDTTAEGTLFLANHGKNVIKIFEDDISDHKIFKLQHLIDFSDKKESFAWPLEFVRSSSDSTIPIGFTMPRMKYEFTLDEVFTLEIDGQPISEHVRWKIATSLLAQVLFLYIHGIQVGDFNSNNFCVTKNGDVVLMDMDSYVIGQMGTQMKGRQAMPFSTDYSKKKDVIIADYIYLVSTVFQIITDGYWPFFYNEDLGYGEYKFVEDENISEEYHEAINAIPVDLKKYFSKVLERGIVTDPFELYFILLENEPEETVQIKSKPVYVKPNNDFLYEEEDDEDKTPPKKESFFTRIINAIKNFFS